MKYFTTTYWKGQRLLLLAFLLAHVIVSGIYITWQNTTFDEKDYYGYGINWLHGNVERNNKMYDSKTPIVIVAAIPRMVKQVLHPGYKATDNGSADIRHGRYFMVFFTLLIAIYLFKWTRRLFGPRSWIIPMLFFLFDPLILGFSMIITSDMASGACLLATMYHLYRFYQQRNLPQLLLLSVWMGIGFVCKASLLYLLPFMLVLLVILLVTRGISFNPRKIFGYGSITAIVVLLVLNIAYFGKGSFRPLSHWKFQSSSFQKMAATPVVKDIPVPLPYSYVQGLDMLQYHAEIGAGYTESTHHGVFIGNQSKDKGGFWFYYLYTSLYKIPLAGLILMLFGLAVLIIGSRKNFIDRAAWVVLPFLFFFCILSFINPFQTGFRHMLLVYPFCFLFIAAALRFLQKKFSFSTPLAYVMLALAFISTACFFPWLIPYTNELITDKKTVFKKMKDASIDYGQNGYQLEQFRKQHQEYLAASPDTLPGKYIVSAFQLINYKHRRNAAWLSSFTPVRHHQYSMFLFDITAADIAYLNKKGRQ